ncbi:MAG: hypothetical protein ACOCRO_04630 [Halanaerobiales bacterium]
MKIESISKEQIKSLRKTLAGIKKKIDWDEIDYDAGRGVVSKTKYCLWTKKGYRIEISVQGRGVIVTQTERKDPNYLKYDQENF